MNNTLSPKNLLIALLFIVFNFSILFAQPGFEDDVNDEPEASLSNYTCITLILGAAAGYYLLSQKNKPTKA